MSSQQQQANIVKSGGAKWVRCQSSHLAVNQLYDVGLVAQALQEVDLVNEAAGGLCIPPCQANSLQGIDLAVWVPSPDSTSVTSSNRHCAISRNLQTLAGFHGMILCCAHV